MATKQEMANAMKEALIDFQDMYEEYQRIQINNGKNWKYIPFDEFESVSKVWKMIKGMVS